MYMFMHNGVIANFMRIRRTLLATLSEQVSLQPCPCVGISLKKSVAAVSCDVQVVPVNSRAQVFNTVQSFHSDSAIAFALFLNNLPDLRARLQPAQLLAAIEASLGRHVLALSVHMQHCCCTMKL
jgi:predicted glutamine amidotransferase